MVVREGLKGRKEGEGVCDDSCNSDQFSHFCIIYSHVNKLVTTACLQQVEAPVIGSILTSVQEAQEFKRLFSVAVLSRRRYCISP